MTPRIRIGIALGLVIVLVGGSLLTIPRLLHPPTAFSLVEQSTLLVLKGTVELQRPGQSFTKIATDSPVRVGDRIRTVPDGFAVVTYFDGSTTTIDPGSEILLRQMDKLPDGNKAISVQQEAGTSWNRVEKLVGPSSRFETTTSSSTAFVRGTEYRVRVEPGQPAIIESTTDTIIVEAVVNGVVITVTVPPGFQTVVNPGEPPSAPEVAPPSAWSFVLEVGGPVSFLLTDNNSRSTGFFPGANAFVNQIPGAKYSVGGGTQRLNLPDPVSSYDITYAAQGEGGSY